MKVLPCVESKVAPHSPKAVCWGPLIAHCIISFEPDEFYSENIWKRMKKTSDIHRKSVESGHCRESRSWNKVRVSEERNNCWWDFHVLFFSLLCPYLRTIKLIVFSSLDLSQRPLSRPLTFQTTHLQLRDKRIKWFLLEWSKWLSTQLPDFHIDPSLIGEACCQGIQL